MSAASSKAARIVIFAKAPVPGRVKTRLIPALGAEGAARLAAQMLAHTVREALASGLEVELCGDPDPRKWGELLPDRGVLLTAQGDGDLGERLARASARVIDSGRTVVLIGGDCPGLDRRRLRDAAAALQKHDAVIHPAADGGYVLLGLGRFSPALFRDMAWSTASVAEATRARIEALGWNLDVRETLRDVDEVGDLHDAMPGGACEIAAPPTPR
jgi:rSAM/selenodomain-associated transferase 1